MERDWPEAWPNVTGSLDEIHTCDPSGDVLLQLQKTIPIVAEVIPEPNDTPSQQPADTESVSFQEPPSSEPRLDGDSLVPQSPPWNSADELLSGTDSYSGQGQEPALSTTVTVYLRVSSKHLILASTMFNTMLCTNTFPEARTLRSEGNLVVKLSDDPGALIILMYIIHGMMRSVPHSITLNTLTEVANLTNYYQLHEAVELFSDMWMTELREQVASENCDRGVVLRWLLIFWVFKEEDNFEKMTRILIRESDDTFHEDIDDESIPIPASIIQRIQETRIEAITLTITIVHDYITRYLTKETICSNNGSSVCDAIVLGSLFKSSMAIGIWPRPEAPYTGMTFKSLVSQVRGMQIFDECIEYRKKNYTRGCHDHQVRRSIEASIHSLENQFCGLKLNPFLPEWQSSKSRQT